MQYSQKIFEIARNNANFRQKNCIFAYGINKKHQKNGWKNT